MTRASSAATAVAIRLAGRDRWPNGSPGVTILRAWQLVCAHLNRVGLTCRDLYQCPTFAAKDSVRRPGGADGCLGCRFGYPPVRRFVR